MSIWRWPQLASNIPPNCRISLGEGNTPLLKSRRIGPHAGIPSLWFKLENLNPTGSYKDRFAAAAVADMLLHEKKRCVATSSGNTGAALAAYCAAAGIDCDIAVVESAPIDKLKQMAACGAKIFKVKNFGADPATTRRVLEWVRQQGQHPSAATQISAYAFSPAGMAGVQSISYELLEQAAEPLQHVFVPAGGGGLTLAIARGFKTAAASAPLVHVHCVQPEGNDTIATPLATGLAHAREVIGSTRISGLQVPSVIDGNQVIAACRASAGTGHLVHDDAVWNMQRRLAQEEGIFCEPAAAVPVLAALNAVAARLLPRENSICCILTGTGFKDAPSIDRMLPPSWCPTLDLSDLH